MMRYTVLILVCLVTQANAQCFEKYDSYYDSIRGNTVYVGWEDSVTMKFIKAICTDIDKSYDTLINLTSNEKRFCKESSFCKELGEITVSIYLDSGEVNRVVTIMNSLDGQFITRFYYLDNSIIYLHQSFEYFPDRHTTDQWINKNGVHGWEAEVYVCDNELRTITVQGIRENKKVIKYLKTHGFEDSPWLCFESNSRKIIDDLITSSSWIKWEFIEHKKMD